MVDKVVVSLVWPIHFHPRGFVSLKTSEEIGLSEQGLSSCARTHVRPPNTGGPYTSEVYAFSNRLGPDHSIRHTYAAQTKHVQNLYGNFIFTVPRSSIARDSGLCPLRLHLLHDRNHYATAPQKVQPDLRRSHRRLYHRHHHHRDPPPPCPQKKAPVVAKSRTGGRRAPPLPQEEDRSLLRSLAGALSGSGEVH